MQSTTKYANGCTCQHCNRPLDPTFFKHPIAQSFYCPFCGKENVVHAVKNRPLPLSAKPDKKDTIKRWIFSFIAFLITGWLMTAEFESAESFAYSIIIIGFFIVIRRIIYFIDGKMNT